MKDTLKIECLVEALSALVSAASECEKARDEFMANGGYSWGYHGQPYIEAKERAAVNFQERLDAYIDDKISKRLAREVV